MKPGWVLVFALLATLVVPECAHALAASGAGTRACVVSNGRQTYTLVCPVFVVGHPGALTILAYKPNPSGLSRAPLAPRVVRIHDARKIGRLTSLLNSLLPLAPNTVSPCPAERGARDVLRFLYANGDLWTVNVQMDGCGFVTSHGVLGWAVGEPAVYNALYPYLDQLAGESPTPRISSRA